MAISDHVTPREAVRADLRDRFRELTDGFVQRVDVTASTSEESPADGEPLWQNVPVVTVKDLEAAIRATFDVKLPPPSERTAEVATPATVFVAADCPRCHLPARIPLTISVELHQDDTGETLHLKGKSKPAIHTCGQMALPQRDAGDDGQEELPLEGWTDEPASPRLLNAGELVERAYSEGVLEHCPFPTCILTAEHSGDHEFLAPEVDDTPLGSDDDSEPDSDDLLPV